MTDKHLHQIEQGIVNLTILLHEYEKIGKPTFALNQTLTGMYKELTKQQNLNYNTEPHNDY